MLYCAGQTERMGSISDGNTVLDFDSEEKKRKYSVSLATASLMWKDIKINILDAPGFLDFEGEVAQAIRAADAAVITVDGKAGVEVGTGACMGVHRKGGTAARIFRKQVRRPGK